MKNFVQPGNVLTLVAGSGGVTSGDIVIENSLIVVAATSAAEGEEYEGAIGGVYEGAKTSAQEWAIGEPVYLTSGGLLTTEASGNTKVGVAAAAAANPSGTGMVRLNTSF